MNKNGFTLMEAILSIAVMAVMLLCYTLMIGVASRFNIASATRQQDLQEVWNAVELGGDRQNRSLILSGDGDEVTIAVDFIRESSGDVSLARFEVSP